MSETGESSKNKNPLLILRRTWNGFISIRRKLRSRINREVPMDRGLHLFTCIVLGLNIFLIIFALISLTWRNLLVRVPLLDSLPLAFYILPLMVILPKILLDLYRTRSGLIAILIMTISAVVFGLISTLVRGFTVLVIVNIIASFLIFIIGRFRPSTPLKSIGKQGIAWFVVMNILGLMMPASVVFMGANPIATITANADTEFFVEMPLADFEYPYVNITTDTSLIDQLAINNFGVDLRVAPSNNLSLQRLEQWVVALVTNDIPYRITISADRSLLVETTDSANSIFDLMVDEYVDTLAGIHNLTEVYSIDSTSFTILFDMSLSLIEWQNMMQYIRSVDLPHFSSYIRNETDKLDSSDITSNYLSLIEAATDYGISSSLIVDGFAIDDIVDGDILIAKMNGLTSEIIGLNMPTLEVSCSRTSYSQQMDGDVGEYLIYSYSLSNQIHSMRLGIAGNLTGTSLIQYPIYESMSLLVNDMVIASGNGVPQIVISSLPSIISTFGFNGLSDLRSSYDSNTDANVTYTFRIYAYRAVMMAIDSFDIIMF